MASYAEKLKDPRWQKKRLRVLDRDGWTCQVCWETEETLHVHHLKYAKSGNPWDSPMKDLQTLCEDCHQTDKQNKEDKKFIINRIKKMNNPEELYCVIRTLNLLDADWPSACLVLKGMCDLYKTGHGVNSESEE